MMRVEWPGSEFFPDHRSRGTIRVGKMPQSTAFPFRKIKVTDIL
jgi:hypothetical protein